MERVLAGDYAAGADLQQQLDSRNVVHEWLYIGELGQEGREAEGTRGWRAMIAFTSSRLSCRGPTELQ